jgi:hypothetical protein
MFLLIFLVSYKPLRKNITRCEYSWLAFVFFAVDLTVCETRGFIYGWFDFEYGYTNLFCFNIP